MSDDMGRLTAYLGIAPAWMDDAACRSSDPDLFHPPSTKGLTRVQLAPITAQIAEAQAVCAGCSVRAECLEYAVVTFNQFSDEGIWGGTEKKERTRLRRQRKRAGYG